MKKVFITIFLILFSLFTVSAQEDFIESDETEAFDDFDSIFDEASDVDEAIVEEEESKPSTPIQIIASAFSSMVRFSGNFTADASLVYAYINENKFSGALTVKNTLYMTVTPVSSFNIRGSFYTGYDNGFSVTVPTFYFDYFLLNRLFISAGKNLLPGVIHGSLMILHTMVVTSILSVFTVQVPCIQIFSLMTLL